MIEHRLKYNNLFLLGPICLAGSGGKRGLFPSPAFSWRRKSLSFATSAPRWLTWRKRGWTLPGLSSAQRREIGTCRSRRRRQERRNLKEMERSERWVGFFLFLSSLLPQTKPQSRRGRRCSPSSFSLLFPSSLFLSLLGNKQSVSINRTIHIAFEMLVEDNQTYHFLLRNNHWP